MDLTDLTDLTDIVYYIIAIEALHNAIAQLPQGERSVLTLICLGYSNTDIAEKLRVDRTTVRRRYRRALPLLREYLTRQGVTECPQIA